MPVLTFRYGEENFDHLGFFKKIYNGLYLTEEDSQIEGSTMQVSVIATDCKLHYPYRSRSRVPTWAQYLMLGVPVAREFNKKGYNTIFDLRLCASRMLLEQMYGEGLERCTRMINTVNYHTMKTPIANHAMRIARLMYHNRRKQRKAARNFLYRSVIISVNGKRKLRHGYPLDVINTILYKWL